MKQSTRSSRYRPRIERLEARLPFAVDGLAIDLSLGDVTPGIAAEEFTVVGASNMLDVHASAMSESSHVFVYSEESSLTIDIFARRTTGNGQPGPPPTLLAQVPLDSTISAGELVRLKSATTVDNGLILVWSDSQTLYAQKFDESLQPLTTRVEIAPLQSSAFGFNDAELDVFENSDGSYSIAFTNAIDSATSNQVTVTRWSNSLTQQLNSWQSEAQPLPAFNLNLERDPSNQVRLTWMSYDPNNATSWIIHASSFNGENLETSTFALNGYSDAPNVKFMDSEHVLVAGMLEIDSQPTAVLELRDGSFDVQQTYILSDHEARVAGLESIAFTSEGTYSVGYLERVDSNIALMVRTFTSDGQEIGIAHQLSDTPLYGEPEGAIFALDSGGVAGYWLGFALDGTSPAVFSETHRPEWTEVEVSFSDEAVVSGGHIRLSGIPIEMGLSHGKRIDANSWEVPLTELGDLKLFSIDEREAVSLQIEYFAEENSNSALLSLNAIFGSETDDNLEVLATSQVIDGRAGNDQLRIPVSSEDVTAVEATSAPNTYALSFQNGSYDLVFRDIERFELNDGILTFAELLELPGESADDDADGDSATDGQGGDDPTHAQDGNTDVAIPTVPPESISENTLLDEEAVPLISVDPTPPYTAGKINGEINLHTRQIMRTDAKPNRTPRTAARPIGSEALQRIAFDVARTAAERPLEHKLTSKGEQREVASKSQEARSDSSDAGQAAAVDVNWLFETVRGSNGVPVNTLVPPDQLTSSPTRVTQNQFEATTHHATAVARESLALLAPPTITESNVAEVTTSIAELSPKSTIQTSIPKSLDGTSEEFVYSVAPKFDAEQLFAKIDSLESKTGDDLQSTEFVVGAAVVVATGFSIANIAALLRSSLLLSKLLSSVPIWFSFDPLPLLDASNLPRFDAEDCAESLADIVQSEEHLGQNQNPLPAALSGTNG